VFEEAVLENTRAEQHSTSEQPETALPKAENRFKIQGERKK